MATTNTALDFAFQLLEDKAKDPNITDDELTDNIAYFLQISGYERTPYKMEFEGFYRARSGDFKNIDEACVEFDNVNKLTYPPDKYAKACRCNLDGHAVFYCSSENGVPVFEVRPKKGQYVVITSFWPKHDDKLKLTLPIIGVKQIKEGLQKHDRRDHIVKMLEDDMHYKKAHSLALDIDSRLADWFSIKVDDDSDNRHIYRLSTAFYNGLVKYAKAGEDRVNSLIYPSVESGITGYNLVMEKEVARENLEVKLATIYFVENIIPNVIFLRPLKQLMGVEEDGKIRWEKAVHSNRLWALEPSAPVRHGPLSELRKHLNRYSDYYNQLGPYAGLGF